MARRANRNRTETCPRRGEIVGGCTDGPAISSGQSSDLLPLLFRQRERYRDQWRYLWRTTTTPLRSICVDSRCLLRLFRYTDLSAIARFRDVSGVEVRRSAVGVRSPLAVRANLVGFSTCRRSRTLVRLPFADNPAGKLCKGILRRVCRPIINHDDFKWSIRLCEYALDGFRDEPRPVVHGNDAADRWPHVIPRAGRRCGSNRALLAW